MWENAASFGALLVFAEHRYFGQSLPFGSRTDPDAMQYLTTDQVGKTYTYTYMHIHIHAHTHTHTHTHTNQRHNVNILI